MGNDVYPLRLGRWLTIYNGTASRHLKAPTRLLSLSLAIAISRIKQAPKAIKHLSILKLAN